MHFPAFLFGEELLVSWYVVRLLLKSPGMGANCCIAARNEPLPKKTGTWSSRSRNYRHSPSWSFRRDSRTHIEDIYDNHASFSCGNSEDVSTAVKNETCTENGGLSNGGTSVGALLNPNEQKSPIFLRTAAKADLPIRSNLFVENHIQEKDLGTSPTKSNDPHHESYIPPLVSSSSTYSAEISSTHGSSVPSGSASSRKGSRLFGHWLYRQISDGRVLKSLKEHDSTERRKSLFLPTSNDLSAGGSQGESPDGWSMRMISELASSSHRDRWLLDSGNLGSGYGQIARSNSHLLASPTEDLQMCGICSKYLMEASPWSSQKLVFMNELPVSAILFCGHAYHAECLEIFTLDIDRCDPPCPVCTTGGKLGFSFLKKAEIKSKNKLSRIAVGNYDLERDAIRERWKGVDLKGKGPLMKGSFRRPLWKRHFSFGLRTSPDPRAQGKQASGQDADE